jgi:hypothetical protein
VAKTEFSSVLARLNALPTDERHGLEIRALTEVLAAANRVTRPAIERRGVEHGQVQARLLRLVAEEYPPLTPISPEEGCHSP